MFLIKEFSNVRLFDNPFIFMNGPFEVLFNSFTSLIIIFLGVSPELKRIKEESSMAPIHEIFSAVTLLKTISL